MPEKNHKQKETKISERPNKLLKLIFAFLFLIIISFVLLRIFFYKTPQEQLAAIEASLAIPDSENAVVYYNTFFADSNNIAILDELWSHSPASNYQPWQSESDHEGSAIFRKNHMFFENFIGISKIPEARFSFDFYDFLNNRISSHLRNITFVLSRAGANDIGDGRIDEAIKKFTSQIMIACHLNQQPMRIYKQVGVAIESVGLGNIRDITMHDNITREQLTLLDTIVSETQNYIGQDKELEDKVNSLHSARVDMTKDYPFINRIKVWFTNRLSKRQNEEIWQKFLLRRMSIQRTNRIMIALRLYQIENSKWPETLDEIESSLPPENFIDAMNNSSFVYKLAGDSFILYSKGPDNIDNNHQKSSDDIVFWEPTGTQVIQKQATDPNQ